MPSVLLCGVPQGSVLGPIFSCCIRQMIADLMKLITTKRSAPAYLRRRHADLWVLCPDRHPGFTWSSGGMYQRRVVVDEVKSVAAEHRQNRSIVTWCVPARHQHLIPNSPLSVCSDNIVPPKHVRDLGATVTCPRGPTYREPCLVASPLYASPDKEYSVSKKKFPLRFSDNFFKTDGNFLINFYTPITRSFLH